MIIKYLFMLFYSFLDSLTEAFGVHFGEHFRPRKLPILRASEYSQNVDFSL